ncbi:MAG: hypothetical protein L0H25_08720 [Micrococcales bacterium]|nr:hypothetical protein [Micrococcales bacterium]
MTRLQIVLAVACGVSALLVAVQILRNRLVGKGILVLLGLIELGLVVQLVLGIGMAFDAPAGGSVATWVGYLVGSLVVLPLAVGWSWAERTRGGTAVILAGLVVVPYLFVRLHQVWHPVA